ncbi:MAG: PD-(D/E)XK nuclease family protein, partial [Clostridia bacterium]|nr:PD-(D/E)XK nuclease family protein [Clostridia bacterium]
EIPITFVADTACGFNYEAANADLVALVKGYIGLKYFDFEKKLKYDTVSRMAVAKLDRQRCIKEEMRLFYVALTRAKHTTYVTAAVSSTKNESFGIVEKIGGATCNLDFISSAICRGSVDVPVYRHLADDVPLRQSEKDVAVLSYDEQIVDAIRHGRECVYPHKTSTKLAMKYSVSALDSIDEQTVRVFEDGASVGTAYHKVMQYIDFFARGEKGVAAELDRLVAEELLTEEERALIDESLIVACLDSEIMELARDAQLNGKCMREQPFMMYKPANELREDFKTDDKVLVQGVIDLYLSGKQNVLIDFKYSKLNDEQLKEKYKTQLNLYKTAIESALRVKVDRALIYSFQAGHAIDCL